MPNFFPDSRSSTLELSNEVPFVFNLFGKVAKVSTIYLAAWNIWSTLVGIFDMTDNSWKLWTFLFNFWIFFRYCTYILCKNTKHSLNIKPSLNFEHSWIFFRYGKFFWYELSLEYQTFSNVQNFYLLKWIFKMIFRFWKENQNPKIFIMKNKIWKIFKKKCLILLHLKRLFFLQLILHPLSTEHLCLKIGVRDQTI